MEASDCNRMARWQLARTKSLTGTNFQYHLEGDCWEAREEGRRGASACGSTCGRAFTHFHVYTRGEVPSEQSHRPAPVGLDILCYQMPEVEGPRRFYNTSLSGAKNTPETWHRVRTKKDGCQMQLGRGSVHRLCPSEGQGTKVGTGVVHTAPPPPVQE